MKKVICALPVVSAIRTGVTIPGSPGKEVLRVVGVVRVRVVVLVVGCCVMVRWLGIDVGACRRSPGIRFIR